MTVGDPRALLGQLTSAIARADVAAAETLLADDLVAVVPQAGDAPLGKPELLSWIGSSTTGTTRLDLYDVVAATPTAVGARVLHTAFASPPPNNGPVTSNDPPDWNTWPTVATANTDPDGRAITQFFLVTDDATQPDRADMTNLVREWYEAYVAQDVDGFLRPLAADTEAINYSSDTTPVWVDRTKMQEGFEQWIEGNTKGGYVVDAIVVRGRYVGVAVQFLTVATTNGQQKLTNEIHVFEMTPDPQMLRSFYYYTNRCGYPDSPCGW